MIKISKFILFILLLIFIFRIFSVEIKSPDFWWHLKTGEDIYQTKLLPEKDTYAYTSLPRDPINPESKRIKFILTQYWLAQIVMYRIYESFGFKGIIALRAFLLTLLVLLTYKALRREGTCTLLSIFMLIPLVHILLSFTGERPQLFSFLFAFLLVFLLDGYRKQFLKIHETPTARKPKAILYLVPLPVIILIWSNMHGGFIIGLAILFGYLIAEIIKYLFKRFSQPMTDFPLKTLSIVFVVSAFLSLMNPNSYNVILVLIELERGYYSKNITEYMSPFLQIKLGFNQPELITFFILLSICILIMLIKFRRLDLTDIVIFSGLTVMSLSGARFIPFFTPVALVYIARYGSMMLDRISLSDKVQRIMKMIETFIFISLVIALIVILNNGNFFRRDINKNKFPEGAVKFLKENKISGNMFNPYVWGGYLIWALYPDYKVFIDGRGLIEAIYFQSLDILYANTQTFEGLARWKSLLKAYRVNFIITFSVNKFTGKLIPLVPALLNDPEWNLIYMDNISLIFLKESSGNEFIKRKFMIPKEWLWNEVITEALIKSRYSKGNINFYITIGDAFFAKKNYHDAKTAYLKAREIEPESSIVNQKLEIIKAYGY